MDTLNVNNDHWIPTSDQVFWGEIAPYDHVVQIYENDDVFLDLLTGFVSSGFNANESVVIIATEVHLAGLDKRLEAKGYPIERLISSHQYLRLDAEATLSKFMVNDWPQT